MAYRSALCIRNKLWLSNTGWRVIYTSGTLCHLFSCKFWVNTSEDKQLVKWHFVIKQDSFKFCSFTGESKLRELVPSRWPSRFKGFGWFGNRHPLLKLFLVNKISTSCTSRHSQTGYMNRKQWELMRNLRIYAVLCHNTYSNRWRWWWDDGKCRQLATLLHSNWYVFGFCNTNGNHHHYGFHGYMT